MIAFTVSWTGIYLIKAIFDVKLFMKLHVCVMSILHANVYRINDLNVVALVVETSLVQNSN